MRHRWSEDDIASIQQARADGQTYRAIAEELDVTETAIRRLIERHQLYPPRKPKKPPLWHAGDGRGQSPLADPYLAKLFEHHRDRAPKSLLRRLLPAPVREFTSLITVYSERRKRRLLKIIEPITPAVPTTPAVVSEFPSLHLLRNGILVKHNLTLAEFMCHSHMARLVAARNEFYVIAAQKTLHSLASIARFANRDHATVLHGITKHCKLHNIPNPRGHFKSRTVRSIAAVRLAEQRAVAVEIHA